MNWTTKPSFRNLKTPYLSQRTWSDSSWHATGRDNRSGQVDGSPNDRWNVEGRLASVLNGLGADAVVVTRHRDGQTRLTARAPRSSVLAGVHLGRLMEHVARRSVAKEAVMMVQQDGLAMLTPSQPKPPSLMPSPEPISRSCTLTTIESPQGPGMFISRWREDGPVSSEVLELGRMNSMAILVNTCRSGPCSWTHRSFSEAMDVHLSPGERAVLALGSPSLAWRYASWLGD